MLSNVMAILLQALAARLGVATGKDLAQACRDSYPGWVAIPLWLLCEAAIIACDLAEVIGTAIALNLLFGIPLAYGAVITVLDALLLLSLMKRGFRFLEAFIIGLLIVIAACFSVQIIMAAPHLPSLLAGFVPSREIVTNPEMLYLAIGIMGATVMPHNLYLHSSIVQTRKYATDYEGRRDAIRWVTLDGTIALMLALFVNAAILVVAAAVFHAGGRTDVADIGHAYVLLTPLLGTGLASVLFAVALLASGLNSTITATLAGQIVMEGFLRLHIPPWARRLLTRAIAIVPVVIITVLHGERGAGQLLILSQVVLSMHLPFAVIPLVWFVSDRRKMGPLAIPPLLAAFCWIVAAVILILNAHLLATLTIWG
jgi:manganese transport protein